MDKKLQHTNEMPKDLTFKKLEEVTNSFSVDHKVGSGGYGVVYKGVLDDGAEIAVKKLHHTPGLDDMLFKKEFDSLMRVRHPNIIRLVAYCYETQGKYVKVESGEHVWAKREERALCFEYMQGGSLEKHLFDESCGLEWHTRYQIIKGICAGLDYLHNRYEQPIYHLDLKPANILLDENMMPKIADFGLSRLFGTTQTLTGSIKGTLGYMPPEYINIRKISRKFDVFSLGVIIIEIMAGPFGYSKCGQMPPQQFMDLLQENWKKRLQATTRYASPEAADSVEEVKTCIETALRCVEADREKRPTIREIINKLNEIETTRMSRRHQNSKCSSEHLEIDPLELRFPFELNREVSCVLQLTNRSDVFIAFSAKVNQSKYYARPDKGVIPPWSKCYIVTTLQAQGIAPPNMQCDDMFLVQSTKVTSDKGTMLDEDITDLVKKMVGKEVDEVKLPIVYVALPPPPSPSR